MCIVRSDKNNQIIAHPQAYTPNPKAVRKNHVAVTTWWGVSRNRGCFWGVPKVEHYSLLGTPLPVEIGHIADKNS